MRGLPILPAGNIILFHLFKAIAQGRCGVAGGFIAVLAETER
jgi:hypothetical protein